MNTKADFRTISHLFGDALSEFSKLFQNELDLAKAELGEKVQQIGGAVGLLAAGAVLVIPAIVMALFALSAALTAGGWSQPTSYLISAVMSGGITMCFVDVAVFLSQSDRVRCPSVGSFLVRNRCGHARSCRRVGIDMYRSLSPFKMIMEPIDLALSRLKQGFDSLRERQHFSHLSIFFG